MFCWDEKAKDKWVHPQDPISIKALDKLFDHQPYANIGGVRAEESLRRFGAVTANRCYKDVTWGKHENHGKGYTFYPIYDWTLGDVWAYIAKNKCNYNRIYDLFFNYGISAHNMRVSNLHHETAWTSLLRLQEVERDTYNRLCNRLPGIATFNHLQKDGSFRTELPEMFTTWAEYRDYLIEKLVRDDLKPKFRKMFKGQEGEVWAKEHVREVLLNDWEGTNNQNFADKINFDQKSVKGGTFDQKYGQTVA